MLRVVGTLLNRAYKKSFRQLYTRQRTAASIPKEGLSRSQFHNVCDRHNNCETDRWKQRKAGQKGAYTRPRSKGIIKLQIEQQRAKKSSIDSGILTDRNQNARAQLNKRTNLTFADFRIVGEDIHLVNNNFPLLEDAWVRGALRATSAVTER
jgi:hypothetical protein